MGPILLRGRTAGLPILRGFKPSPKLKLAPHTLKPTMSPARIAATSLFLGRIGMYWDAQGERVVGMGDGKLVSSAMNSRFKDNHHVT